ncbi:hypothetical protein ABZ519_15665 [Streptomyces collinus]|uniref:hypothetical protein n=1 Tax=Streptomyces collinus TaxID=42684 RepID=UPI0033C017C0
MLKIDGWDEIVEELKFPTVSDEKINPVCEFRREWTIAEVRESEVWTNRPPLQEYTRTARTTIIMTAPYDDGPSLPDLLIELGARAGNDITSGGSAMGRWTPSDDVDRQQRLNRLIEVGRGQQKPLKECTVEELRRAAELLSTGLT